MESVGQILKTARIAKNLSYDDVEKGTSIRRIYIEAIENDTDTPLGVMDGLQPVLMGLAAKKSLEEHRPVKISEITV